MVGYRTIVSTEILKDQLDSPDSVVVDCRFSLKDLERGRRDYLAAHLPGARYAHLEEDLSGVIEKGRTGRHPLPPIDRVVEVFSSWGIGPGSQVFAYDDSGGAIAARIWWMLNWLGHDRVAVLDGGWPSWIEAGLPHESTIPAPEGRRFVPNPRNDLLVSTADVESIRSDPSYRLLDAREEGRYRGENEPIDPIAGHIPGAISAPFRTNLDSKDVFLPKKVLCTHYRRLMGDVPAHRVICYCGSGVTAAHDLLAIAFCGLGEGKLYVGSWSKWIVDSARPIAAA